MSCENLHSIPFEQLKKLSKDVKDIKYDTKNDEADTKFKVFKNPRFSDYNHGHVSVKRRHAHEVRSDKPVAAPHSILSISSQSKNRVRDPRFSDFSGDFNKDSFIKRYKFIDDLQLEEMKLLKSQIKLETNEISKKNLQRRYAQLFSILQRRKMVTKELKLKKQLMEKEKEAIAKTGKKPYMPKKSQIKEMLRKEKLEELQKSDKKYKKYLIRKSKKEKSKSRKFKPKFRREKEE